MTVEKSKLSIFLLFIFYTSVSIAQTFIPLWPEGQMPNSKGIPTKHIEEGERITQVEIPGLYVFTPSIEENKESAVLICPPGGYGKQAYNIAGFQWAKWCNTLGMSAFVLIYRLPTSPDLILPHLGPIQDAQRAMKIIRSKTVECKINPGKIGVMGASAGGHLAATLGTLQRDYSIIKDSLDSLSFQPNFTILISPVISMGEYAHEGSKVNLLGENPVETLCRLFSCELKVHKDTPPAFVVHAHNDNVVHPMNSLLYSSALLDRNISVSLHLFPQGGHSIALRNNPGSANQWTVLCESWLKEMGLILK